MAETTGEVCTCRFRPWPDPEQEDHEINPGCPRHGDVDELDLPHGLDPGQVC